ncbi:MAG: FAD binding domain-containing protein, partial [Candidatus Aminicenantales bacterium]
MREFRIAQPKTVEELAALLAEAKEKALIMAGGTDLIDELKSGVAAPDMVVDIQGVAGLAGIARDKDGLRIGP